MLRPPDPGSTRRIAVGLVVMGLAGYFWVLARHASYSAAAADGTGYLNHAQALVHGELVRPARAAARLGLADVPGHLLVPLGFAPGPRPGSIVPSYPAGLPLHMAAFAALLGWERGPFLVSPLFAVLAVVATYLLGRELDLSRLEAGAGALVLALHPVCVLLALIPMSDGVATAWATLAVVAGLRARRRAGWALAAGAAFSVACLVRPSNALLLLPLALALPWSLRALVRFALGATPGFVLIGTLNHLTYGHPLRTGYGNVAAEFVLDTVRQRWNHYTRWLGKTFTPLVPVAWIAVTFARDVRRRDRALLLVWFASYFLFYCAYKHHDAWWYLRFLMPAFPALVVAAILALRPVWRLAQIRVHVPRLNWASGSLVPLLALALVVQREVALGAERRVLTIGEAETIYPRACRDAAARLPPRSLILSFLMSGALEYYTDLPHIRFDNLDRRTARDLLRRTHEQGYGWYALVHPNEREVFEGRDIGNWHEIPTPTGALLYALDPHSLKASIPSRPPALPVPSGTERRD